MSDPSQFDDADTDLTSSAPLPTPDYAAPRQPGVTYIDDDAPSTQQPSTREPISDLRAEAESLQQQLVWDDYPDGVDDDDNEEEEVWDESEEEEEEMMRRGEVNDEDWEGAERGECKAFRLLFGASRIRSGRKSVCACSRVLWDGVGELWRERGRGAKGKGVELAWS